MDFSKTRLTPSTPAPPSSPLKLVAALAEEREVLPDILKVRPFTNRNAVGIEIEDLHTANAE